MNLPINSKWATKILLGTNLFLLLGTAMILMFILLENSTEMYSRAYYATLPFQPFIVKSWFLSLALSPLFVIIVSVRFGQEIRKKIEWKISIVIMVIAGLPSLVFVLLGFVMHGFP